MKKRSKIAVVISLFCALSLACFALASCAGKVKYTYSVTNPTKTSYVVGEEFDPSGFAITRLGSDETAKTLEASEYTLDSSAYDKTKVGTYAITYAVIGAEYSGSFNVTVAANTFADTLTIANATFTYDGLAHSATVFTVPTGATLRFAVGDGEWGTTNPTFTEVGVYSVKYELSQTGYTTKSGTFTVTITANTFADTLTIANATFTYDGLAHSATVFTVPTGATLRFAVGDGEWGTTNPTFTEVGVYSVKYELSQTGYTTKSGTFTVTITGLPPVEPVEGVTVANSALYSPREGKLWLTINGTQSGDAITYSTDNGRSWQNSPMLFGDSQIKVKIERQNAESIFEVDCMYAKIDVESMLLQARVKSRGNEYYVEPLTKDEYDRDYDLVRTKVENGDWSDWIFLGAPNAYGEEIPSFAIPNGATYAQPTFVTYEFYAIKDGMTYSYQRVLRLPVPVEADSDKFTIDYRAASQMRNSEVYTNAMSFVYDDYSYETGQYYASVGANIDLQGFVLECSDNDEYSTMREYDIKELTITSNYIGEAEVVGIRPTKAGEMEVNVYIGDFKKSLNVIVLDFKTETLEGKLLNLSSAIRYPNKRVYKQGEALDLTGMRANLRFRETYINFPDDCYIAFDQTTGEAPDMTTVGKKTVQVYFKHQNGDGYYTEDALEFNFGGTYPMVYDIFVVAEDLPFVGKTFYGCGEVEGVYFDKIEFLDNSQLVVDGEAQAYSVTEITEAAIKFTVGYRSYTYNIATQTIDVSGNSYVLPSAGQYLLHGELSYMNNTATFYAFTDVNGKASAGLLQELTMYSSDAYSDEQCTQLITADTVFTASQEIFTRQKTADGAPFLGVYTMTFGESTQHIFIFSDRVVTAGSVAPYTTEQQGDDYVLTVLNVTLTYRADGILIGPDGETECQRVDLTDKAVVTFRIDTADESLSNGVATLFQIIDKGDTLSDIIITEDDSIYKLTYADYDGAPITQDTVLDITDCCRLQLYGSTTAGTFDKNYTLDIEALTLTEKRGLDETKTVTTPITIVDLSTYGVVFTAELNGKTVRGSVLNISATKTVDTSIMVDGWLPDRVEFVLDGVAYPTLGSSESEFYADMPFINKFNSSTDKSVTLYASGSAYLGDLWRSAEYEVISIDDGAYKIRIKDYNIDIVYYSESKTVSYAGAICYPAYIGNAYYSPSTTEDYIITIHVSGTVEMTARYDVDQSILGTYVVAGREYFDIQFGYVWILDITYSDNTTAQIWSFINDDSYYVDQDGNISSLSYVYAD